MSSSSIGYLSRRLKSFPWVWSFYPFNWSIFLQHFLSNSFIANLSLQNSILSYLYRIISAFYWTLSFFSRKWFRKVVFSFVTVWYFLISLSLFLFLLDNSISHQNFNSFFNISALFINIIHESLSLINFFNASLLLFSERIILKGTIWVLPFS